MANDTRDHKGDGKAHTVRLRHAELTYWGKGVATGYNGADKVEVCAPYSGGFPRLQFDLPAESQSLVATLGLMDAAFTHGKRKAKHELRRWLELEP